MRYIYNFWRHMPVQVLKFMVVFFTLIAFMMVLVFGLALSIDDTIPWWGGILMGLFALIVGIPTVTYLMNEFLES